MNYLDYEPAWQEYRNFYAKLGFPRKLEESDGDYTGDIFRDTEDGTYHTLSLPRFIIRSKRNNDFSQKWIK